MWGPYECFSSAELGDAQFYAYFFPIAGLRPSCERQRAVTAGNPANYGLFWSSVIAELLAVLRTHVNWGSIGSAAD
jgi:hypothetical protein